MSGELTDESSSNEKRLIYALRPPSSTSISTTSVNVSNSSSSVTEALSIKPSSKTAIEEIIQESLVDRYFDTTNLARARVNLIQYKRAEPDSSPLDTSVESLSDLSLNNSSSSSSSSSSSKFAFDASSRPTSSGVWFKLKRKMRSNLSKFSFMFTFLCTWILILVLYHSGFLFASESTFFKTIPALFPDHVVEMPPQSFNSPPGLASAFIVDESAASTTNLDSCHRNLVDIHDGSLTYLHHAIEFNQYVFIYLYAHWDARSIFFSSLIKQLACKYSSESNQVLFLTVNCFNPNGECRRYFNLIKYPQVVFQVRNSGIFSYKGPMEMGYISEFIDHLMAPIRRLDSVDELVDFTIANQVVAVANLNLNNQSENDLYKTYYLSALKAFSLNSENPIKYGIVLNQTIWRQIKTEFQDPVLERLRGCKSPAAPDESSGSNSSSLSPSDDDDIDNKIMIFDLFGYKKSLKNANRTTVDSLTLWAQNNFKRILNWSFPDRDGINTRQKSGRPNLLVFTRKATKSADKLEELFKYLIVEDWHVNRRLDQQTCRFRSRVVDKLRSSLSQVLKSDETLLVREEEQCWSAPSSVFSKYATEASEQPEQACRKGPSVDVDYLPFNQSVQVDLLDLDIYLNYAKSLLHESKHSVIEDDPRSLIQNGTESIVILVDYQHENLNWLQKTPSYQNIRDFIAINQKHNLNNRHIRVKEVVNEPRRQIEEINTRQMVQIFANEEAPLFFEKDLLVFYFNNWCGFCKTASFMLNDLIYKHLKNCPSFKMVEIDTDSNDLPWDLHAQHLPALLFKPARSRETTFFNYDQRFTVKELLSFVLHNAGDAETLKCYLNENVVKAGASRERLRSAVEAKVSVLSAKVSRFSRQLEELEAETGDDRRRGLDEYGNYTLSRTFWSLKTQLYFHTKHLNLVKDFSSLFN